MENIFLVKLRKTQRYYMALNTPSANNVCLIMKTIGATSEKKPYIR